MTISAYSASGLGFWASLQTRIAGRRASVNFPVSGTPESQRRERARHDATLPFTRFLAGHADYTPVHFGDRRADTTWAHQIATAAVFTAPLLTYASHPETLLENPAVEIIKSIPAVWDETLVLEASEIGQVAVFARRRGETWFLAAVNGASPRELKIPLAFLDEGEYRALVVRDDPDDAAAVQLDDKSVSRRDAIEAALASGGGLVVRFTREANP